MRSWTVSSPSTPLNDGRNGAIRPGAGRQACAHSSRFGGRVKSASDFLNLELDTRVRLMEEMRSNDIHASMIDPPERLYRKARAKKPGLSLMGHAVMENCKGSSWTPT